MNRVAGEAKPTGAEPNGPAMRRLAMCAWVYPMFGLFAVFAVRALTRMAELADLGAREHG
jgi:hypothetical protein